MSAVDVLVPTCARPGALAVTPTSLCAQDASALGVVVSDQTGDSGVLPSGVYHQELPTTLPDRRVPADRALGWRRTDAGTRACGSGPA